MHCAARVHAVTVFICDSVTAYHCVSGSSAARHRMTKDQSQPLAAAEGKKFECFVKSDMESSRSGGLSSDDLRDKIQSEPQEGNVEVPRP